MTHETRRVTLHRSSALRTALLTCSISLLAASQIAAQDIRVFPGPEGHRRVVIWGADRPMIGVTTTAESARADTLGLRVEDVMRGSPAERAGLKEGDRLQSVNGASLRADRADAGEAGYVGVLTRRLQRAVQATKPGESVTLLVLTGGAVREVRMTPVKASEITEEGRAEMWKAPVDDRAVLGLTVGSTGSTRDTLGVFVQSVVTGGPAEKAGIVEGDRIAAINGVSLRVAREDASDRAVGSARAERLSREIAKLTAGDAAELTVVTAGRSRTVHVTTAKASDLPAEARGVFMLPELEGILRAMPREREMLREREMPRIQPRTPEGRRMIERSLQPRTPIVVRRTIRTEI